MSRTAAAILDTLHERGPLVTPELRKAVNQSDPDRGAEFDRAMAEVQRGLWVTKVEEIYDPDFYYRWDLLDNWLPDPLAASLDLERGEAVRRLLATYLRGAAVSQPRFLAGLFGLGSEEVEAGLAALEESGAVRRAQRLRGLPGSWSVWMGKPGAEERAGNRG
jgi:uncharacterized protein YcaQ